MSASFSHTRLPNGITVVQHNQGETDFVYREIFEDHCYLKHGITVEQGACVFDVGANIGLFALYVSSLRRRVQVYAFEPLPPLYRLLKGNRRLCGMRNVQTFPYGLSGKAGRATFTYYPRNSIMSGRYADDLADREIVKTYLRHQLKESGATRMPPEALIDGIAKNALASERYECELHTLSEVIAMQRIERIDLLKLDVEKSEVDILQGIADSDWPKIRQLVVEVYSDQGQLSIIECMLRRHGFQFAVEQDDCLRGSSVYIVYARRR
jgi:FkbM family methyltransferase